MPIAKPESCRGCVLESRGTGYAPAVGPAESPLLLVGEALGREEARRGEPFVGPSGELLNRLLGRVNLDRNSVRIDNVVRCQPPNDWLVGAPWEHAAVGRCAGQYLSRSLQEPHQAIVSLGASSTRRLLGLQGRGHKQNDWHGCPTREATSGKLAVPTFHPAYLLRGNQKLIGTVCFDLQVAQEVASGTWQREDAELTVDPSPEWFRAWALEYREACSHRPETAWLAVDIETVRKSGRDEGELDDVAGDAIVRVNFAYHPDHGVTVPFLGQYLHIIRDLLSTPGPKCLWNARYDVPRLRLADVQVLGPILDFMWAWHVLQSDLPRGLGFVAPFYSKFGAWKHLSGTDPGRYAAIDAVQTLRCAFGIARDLESQGMWEVFRRHVVQLDSQCLGPAEEVGLLVDRKELSGFQEKLTKESARLEGEIQKLVPDLLRPRSVWKRDPGPEAGAECLHYQELVQACDSCGAVQVAKTHRCADRKLVPRVQLSEHEVPRWVRLEPFNPASPQQLLDYITWKGLKGGKSKKSKTEQASTDVKVLEGLAKTTKDPFYALVLKFRDVEKVRGTYVEGIADRLGADGRLHPSFLHVPSTLRLSCVNPNLQNITRKESEGEGEPEIWEGFRRCLVAAPGCVLIEVDYSAIEAVLAGWFMGDPNFIRLAKLGIHDYHAGHVTGRPANLSWSDQDLLEHFGETKKRLKATKSNQRDKSKRTIYGTLYGMSAYGLHKTYPELFPNIRAAQDNQNLLYRVCPKLKTWQEAVKDLAWKRRYLGGEDHPFHYRHWFWQVKTLNSYGELVDGEDAKRCVAYYPQSTAAGVIKEAALRATERGGPDYIGEAYFGRTPIRAIVHDSLLVESPLDRAEGLVEALVRNMTREIRELPCPPEWGLGAYLKLGVEAKVGKNWEEMEVQH